MGGGGGKREGDWGERVTTLDAVTTLLSTQTTSAMAVTLMTNHLKADFELELVDYFYSVIALLYKH